eukprot:1161195-Pelagomonas_calceolata.AAC.17
MESDKDNVICVPGSGAQVLKAVESFLLRCLRKVNKHSAWQHEMRLAIVSPRTYRVLLVSIATTEVVTRNSNATSLRRQVTGCVSDMLLSWRAEQRGSVCMAFACSHLRSEPICARSVYEAIVAFVGHLLIAICARSFCGAIVAFVGHLLTAICARSVCGAFA